MKRLLPLVVLVASAFAFSAASASAVYSCGGKRATIVGTGSNNTLVGTSGNDVIVGLGGGDNINGKVGDDIICGNRGADYLHDTSGRNKIYGGRGNDDLEDVSYFRNYWESDSADAPGVGLDDLMDGGGGADSIYASTGNDRMLGGSGNDTFGEEPADNLDPPQAGSDEYIGGDGNDWIYASDGMIGNDLVHGDLGTDECYAEWLDTRRSCEVFTGSP